MPITEMFVVVEIIYSKYRSFSFLLLPFKIVPLKVYCVLQICF